MRTFSILFSLAFVQVAHAECIEPTGVVGPIRRFNAGQDYHRCLISELQVDVAELRALVGTLNERVTATEGNVDELYECIDECSEPVAPDDIEINLSFTGPSSWEVGVGGADEYLMSFCIESNAEVTVKDLVVKLYGDDDGNREPFDGRQDVVGSSRADGDGLIGLTGANLADIKLVDLTGTVVMGPMELRDSVADNDAVQSVAFTDDFTVYGGEAMCLRLNVDIGESPSLGVSVIGASVDMSELVIEDENGDRVPSTAIVPFSDIVGGHVHVLGVSASP